MFLEDNTIIFSDEPIYIFFFLFLAGLKAFLFLLHFALLSFILFLCKCYNFYQLEFNFQILESANRAVEVNEMWRTRQKELELDDRLKGKLKEESSSGSKNHRESNSSRSTNKRHSVANDSANASCSSSKRAYSSHSREDDGLRDEELEEFLHSR